MRYLDWDVLIFPSPSPTPPSLLSPAGEDGQDSSPVKEFKIQCQAEQKNAGAEPTPLMTAFIPSMNAGQKFQVSVHSWSATKSILLPGPDGHQPRELWEVRVVIDGKVATVAHLPVDALWPQIISTATNQQGQEFEEHKVLCFPPFQDGVRNQPSWTPSDEQGRIRVELSAGLWDEKHGGFAKMANIVTFAFQHAPLYYLEQAGIAWPSVEMFTHALPRQAPPAQFGRSNNSNPAEAVAHPTHMAHRKMPSMNSLQLPMVNPAQAFAGPVNRYQNYGNFDPASRSTSAYSTVSASAGPIIPNTFNVPAPQQESDVPAHPVMTARENQFQFRLPSDQLAQIISALNAPKQEQVSQHAMPPPPLPGHATHNKNENAPIGHYAPLAPRDRTDLDQQALNAIDRRAASNSGYSDVSMHAACENFPRCITEDPNGCLEHDSMAVPAGLLKGKKEGSSPTKPRDFLSVALDAPATSANHAQHLPSVIPMTIAPMMTMHPSPVKATQAQSSSLVSSSPADASGKKRTRSALKALNINDGGSPQKADAANKPVRKASRASVSSFQSNAGEKENVSDQFLVEHPEGSEDQENMMLDA